MKKHCLPGTRAVALWLLVAMLLLSSLFSGCSCASRTPEDLPFVGQVTPQPTPGIQKIEPALKAGKGSPKAASLNEIPPYADSPVVYINGNVPLFTGEEQDILIRSGCSEIYSKLDILHRCGYALALVSRNTMPEGERESISEVRPTGWVNHKYDFIENGYVYNRCHLIGYQLTGENANERNLITGTRYMNVEAMLPFENAIASYVRSTGRQVLYRVTPVFDGENLLASGVLLEARSVQDEGKSFSFCVYCYNVQPGVTIDYATGENGAIN